MRGGPDDREQQGGEDGLQVETVVEAELELCEIPGKVPCAAPAADAKDVALQVGDHRIHGLERLHLGAPPSAFAFDRLMGDPRVGHAPKGGEAVRNDVSFRGESLLRPGNDGLSLEIGQNLENSKEHLPVVFHRCLDRHQERLFARCTTSPFTFVTGTPSVGIVDLDTVPELPAGFRRACGAENLLFQIVGRGVTDTQAAFEFQGGDGVLSLGESIHGFEPSPKGEMAGLAHRPHHDGGLVATNFALEEPTLGHEVGFASITIGAAEPIRPFGLRHGLQALLLGAIIGLERAEGQALLELNLVDRH